MKDNYVILEPDPSLDTYQDDVNWADWTSKSAAARYVPSELTHELLLCGRQFSFFAFEAPDWLYNQQNITRSANLIG